LAYWFYDSDGGVGAVANLGGTLLEYRTYHHSLRQALRDLRSKWFVPGAQGTYDVGVMVVFLFPDGVHGHDTTIVTGSACERWKYAAFIISTFFLGAFTYLSSPMGLGRRVACHLGTNFGLGKGYCDFAGSGVVHSVGGVTALAVAMMLGPRIGSMSAPENPTPSSRTTSSSC